MLDLFGSIVLMKDVRRIVVVLMMHEPSWRLRYKWIGSIRSSTRQSLVRNAVISSSESISTML